MKLTNIVNKTQVQGSEKFIYNVEISISSLDLNPIPTKVKTYFPTNIKYNLPEPTGKLKDIDIIKDDDGDYVTFDFGNLLDGDSIKLNMSCNFDVGRNNNDKYINTISLYQNNINVLEKSAKEVTLSLEEDFNLYKEIDGIDNPRPGESIIFKLILEQKGDYGYKINNINISDVLPQELTLDQSFTPIGYDESSSYKDIHLDGLTGNTSNNTINFTLDHYNGEKYVITFKAIVNENLEEGTTITNNAIWSIDNIEKYPATISFNTFIPIASATFYKNGPTNINIGDTIQYNIYFNNDGTEDLNNLKINDTMPEEVNIEYIKAAVHPNQCENYSLYIKTNQRNDYFPLMENIEKYSPIFNLKDVLNKNEYLTNIELRADKMIPQKSYIAYFLLSGTIKESAKDKKSINNNATLFATTNIGNIERTYSKTTYINDKSVLQLYSNISNETESFYPTKEFLVEMTSSTSNGTIKNPVYSVLLPNNLIYTPNNEYYTYYDEFKSKIYNSKEDNFPIKKPDIEIIDNYNDTTNKLLRFKFNDTTLKYRSSLTIFFTIAPAIGSSNEFNFTTYMGDPKDDSTVFGSSHYDENNLDGDNYTDEYIAKSNELNGIILYVKDFSAEKLVKGNVDNTFTNSGRITKGGNLEYNLIVTNNQEANLENIEIIDILPHINDTGVILTNEQRNSEFNVYLRKNINTKILNIITGLTKDINEINYEYSTSTNPIRFDKSNNIFGDGTWITELPNDLTTIKSIKINTNPGFYLKPYEKLIVTLPCAIPLDANVNDIAYNSFAVKSNVVSNDETLKFLPTEPSKVGIKVTSTKEGSIGTYIWNDTNQNGILDNNEIGINGITIELYDEFMNFINATISTNDTQANPGYYLFPNLLPNNYFIKFIETENNILTKQVTNNNLGSKPNQDTGLTNLITLNNGQNIFNIDAGFIKLNEPIITAHNQIIKLYEKYNPLDNVTAVNSLGKDITNQIIITKNEVNTYKEGTYQVTYKITDEFNKTDILTIYIKVIDIANREQAITNLILSVSEEELGISKILNNESLKIDKAIELNLDPQEIIQINESINNMINTINYLEIILQLKLTTVTKCNNYCKKKTL